ncbi:sugar transferase [Erysipelothrix anatis]|uniref:sugar transferase n=1 Tax=Erysipelothrix anatis TaxID=2683713 RepID=UPI00135AADD7|nr:sugar transferase [Erysipelothrix anatis]
MSNNNTKVIVIANGISILVSYLISTLIFLLTTNNYEFFYESLSRTIALIVFSWILTEVILQEKNQRIFERNNLEEIFSIIKNIVIFVVIYGFTTYILKISVLTSRYFLLIFSITSFFVTLLIRNKTKQWKLKKNPKSDNCTLIITTSTIAGSKQFEDSVSNNITTKIIGIALLDTDSVGQSINEINVVANAIDVEKFARNEIVDSVIIFAKPNDLESFIPIIEKLKLMGIVIHVNIDSLNIIDGINSNIEYIGRLPVISYAEVFQDNQSLVIKRFIDIIGGIVGSVLTILVMLILGPIIKMESPGPIIFKQQRVGKNGRFFTIYKFRSMGVDAEARKKDLMSENEVDGHMFKMSNDPRVTKVGKFIRTTSIDELPQFFNVVKGDMSLVGTRPPTINEFREYESHHKRRLSMKPGITGMWQVSGRSNITDFEQVVLLDVEYIDNYSIWFDIKILLKTCVVVFAKIGSK